MGPRVNRCLEDKAMDHIDHALGRPLDPTRETYRSHFAVDGPVADEMALSPHWKEYAKHGQMRYFQVTAAGRKALAQHLKDVGDPHRAFVVSFEGYETVVAATSAAKAKYIYWLDVSDAWSELTFPAFCRGARVKVA